MLTRCQGVECLPPHTVTESPSTEATALQEAKRYQHTECLITEAKKYPNTEQNGTIRNKLSVMYQY